MAEQNRMKWLLGWMLLGSLCVAGCLWNAKTSAEITEETMETGVSQVVLPKNKSYCVVIDAGHGGADPGKVGVGGTLEKDLNLVIASKLKTYLELQDVRVVMTRTEDELLVDQVTKGFKSKDMKARVQLIEESQPDAVISIHQNSYTSEKVKGAQVFYYTKSEEGHRLAELVQGALQEKLDRCNQRKIKDNSTYYMLKNTTVPLVIAECGFLSNREEASLLETEDYQDRVAWTLGQGVLRYLNTLE